MIGILSNKSKIQTYSYNLFSLFRSVTDNGSNPLIIIFTLSNIDFSNKTVYGTLIRRGRMEKCKMPIPDIILNFSHQQKRLNRKKIKLLAEQDNVTLLNEVNQFSQDMIMDMLSSSPYIKPMLLNYNIYNHENNTDDFLIKNDILALPKKGLGPLKTIWIKKDDQSASSINENQGFSLPDIFAPDSKMSKKDWIMYDTPNLLLHEDQPVIITLYLQKYFGKTWKVLPNESCRIIENIDLNAIEIVKYINCFIPNLAFCTVSFVLDEYYIPFFINLKGWDSSLLLDKENHNLQMSFIKNLFVYYDYLKAKQKGGINFVG